MRNLNALVLKIIGVMMFSCIFTHHASAAIQPSTSAVIIPAGKDEASIDIKNHGNETVLLYSRITQLPDDNLSGGTIFADPQTVLIGPGESQSIRIVYQTNTPDKKEHIARVVFTGLPPNEEVSEGKIKFLIGQDLPVVINARKDLPQKDMWERMVYSIKNNSLCIHNPSAKVFRFSPAVVADEGGVNFSFKKPYILPDETLCEISNRPLLKGMHVNITSVSDYNYRIKTNKVTL